MANSPAHQLGEFIGAFFEDAIVQYLKPIVTSKGYYLDYRHPRPARKNKSEVVGKDAYGSEHKLDIVVEKGGTEAAFGTPKAFLEMAWWRYTKHSKNKVQEISGAILPLVDRYASEGPFYAAVLAGEFTENSLEQLRRQGFYVVHFPYEEICRLFDSIGVNIRWDEDSSDTHIQNIANDLSALGKPTRIYLMRQFRRRFQSQLEKLSNTLCAALDSPITQVTVTPLYGNPQISETCTDAAKQIAAYDYRAPVAFLRYEILLRYSSGKEYRTTRDTIEEVQSFLAQYV